MQVIGDGENGIHGREAGTARRFQVGDMIPADTGQFGQFFLCEISLLPVPRQVQTDLLE